MTLFHFGFFAPSFENILLPFEFSGSLTTLQELLIDKEDLVNRSSGPEKLTFFTP